MELFPGISWVQLSATLFSIIYILLAVNNKRICFLFGAIASSLWAFEDFFKIDLYFDGLLQLYYILMSIYGWLVWTGKENEVQGPSIRSLTITQHVIIISIGILISIFIAWISTFFFEARLPYLDAITTAFALIATYLLAKRYIDNWYYWLVINPLYIYIFFQAGAYFFAGIMALYTIMSLWGYIQWNRIRSTN